MKTLTLLASVAVIALAAVDGARAAEPETEAVVVVVPAPVPAPRGVLGGLFKRKQRPPEPIVVAPALVEAADPAPIDPAPIDLVPPAAEAAAASADAAPTPETKRTTFVLRRVPDAEVPAPRRNPLRAPTVTAEVDVAIVAPESEIAEAEVIPAPGAFEPEVPPPASAASEPAPEMLESGEEEPTAEPAIESDGVALPEPLPAAEEPVLVPAADSEDADPPQPAAPAAEPVAAEETAADTETVAGTPAVRIVGPVVVVPAGEALERVPALTETPVANADTIPEAATDAADMEARMAAEKLVAAARDSESPRELVDLLARAQDAIAVGSVPALAAQRRIRVRIDEIFAAADPAVWQEPGNAIAAVAYVLSGGTPDVLAGFLDMEPKPAVDERLSRGALAYMQGRRGEAAGMLLDLDVETLPARISGQVAMAQAALLVGTDPKAALARLDQARLVAPGTLVEEAAIRRSLFIVDQLRDEERFERLVRQYLERFKHSIYAGNFRYRFAAALTHSPLLDDPAEFGRLDAMLARLEPDAQRSLYLTVASAAVIAGKMDAGAYAADKALALAGPASPDQSRARVYRAAAMVVEAESFAIAEEDLAAINVAILAPSDRALLDAVAKIAASVRAGSDVAAMVLEPIPEALPGEEPPAEPDPLLDRARALSDEVDLLLASAS
jgi:chemotaxis protein MotC